MEEKNKKKKKIFVLICITFVLAGFSCLFIPISLFAGFFSSLGASMINCALVSFVWNYYLSEFDEERNKQRIDEHFKIIEELVDYKNKKQETFDNAGLKYIHKDRSYLTNQIKDILQRSKSSVKILGESLNSFTEISDFDEIMISTLRRGIDIKIALCSLKSPSLDERYKELKLKKEESIGLHKGTLKTYYNYYNYAAKNNYSMKLFKKHPKLILVIVDDKHVYVQHYSYGMKGYEAPLFEFTEGELGIENYYLKFFNNVWNDVDTKEAKYEEKDFK